MVRPNGKYNYNLTDIPGMTYFPVASKIRVPIGVLIFFPISLKKAHVDKKTLLYSEVIYGVREPMCGGRLRVHY